MTRLSVRPPFRLIALLAMLAASANIAAARDHRQVQRLRVRFLATGSEIHGTWGMNEDDFLASKVSRDGTEGQLIFLVDEYVSGTLSLSRDVLTSESGTVLRLKRDTMCDRPFGQIPLRAAPGDPLAILPISLQYDPQLPKPPDSNEVIACFRVVHRWK